MIEAIRVHVRYDYPDENEETRRERHERFEQPPPPPQIVPLIAIYLWDWFFEVSASISRINDYRCNAIPPSEWQAWARMSGNIVRPAEYAILCAMDGAFRSEMNKELEAFQIRQAEANKRNE